MGSLERFTAREDFPLDALPKCARAYVGELAHVLQVEPTVVALAVLGATAIAVQGKAELAVRGGWVEQLSYWILMALRSGNRKTPALLRPMAPLRAHEARENEQRAAYRRRLRDQAAAISPNAPDRRQRAQAFEDAEPPELELFGSDLTPEAIAIALAEQNENYAIVTDEPTSLALVLNGLYAEGRGSNTGILMAGYSGSPYRRRRVKSAGARLDRPALSLLLIGQPGVFDDLTSRESLIELGFVGRLLVARPRDLLGERKVHSDGIDPDVAGEYALLMKTILAAPSVTELPDLTGGYGNPDPWPRGKLPRHQLELTPEARELHVAAEVLIEPLLAETGVLGDLSDFGAKLSGLIARSAALLHVLHDPDRWWMNRVGLEPMQHAIEVGRYALGQVLALWSAGAQERHDAGLAGYVLERARALVTNGAGIVTWRALSRALVQGNGRGRIRTSEDLRRLVDLLVERGDLIPDRTSVRGAQWVLAGVSNGADHESVPSRYGAHEEAST